MLLRRLGNFRSTEFSCPFPEEAEGSMMGVEKGDPGFGK
jgi:hypothetical protein